MELISRKILIEDLTSRKPGITYGTITATSVYINVMLTQNIDDMGVFTDAEYIPSSASTATTVIDYYTPEAVNEKNVITGTCESKLRALATYSRDNKYQLGRDVKRHAYINYKGDLIDARNRIIQLTGGTKYVIDAEYDSKIGTTAQTTGILYIDSANQTIQMNPYTGENVLAPTTYFQFQGEGWNETNTSLSALTKEEMFFGIVSPPEVESDVFIERGSTSVLEPHLKLSEIESVSHLEIYGNGYYNLNK